MLINYDINVPIRLKIIENLYAIFRYIDNNIIELSFDDPDHHNISLIDTSLGCPVKHYHNAFYINLSDHYTINFDGKPICIIKPIHQHELLNL